MGGGGQERYPVERKAGAETLYNYAAKDLELG